MQNVILQANEIFKTAGFDYAVCGGFALDMFAGKELRPHGDFDITIFKEDKHRAVQFMKEHGWGAYGRFMEEGRMATLLLFFEIDDITNSYWDDCRNMWAIKPDSLPNVLHKLDRIKGPGDMYTYQTRKWLVQDTLEFIELEFDIRDGNNYVAKENPQITRPMDKAILHKDGVPYLAPEIILFFKTDKLSWQHPNIRPKTEGDFNTIMPLLSDESKQWLRDAVDTAYPDGHEWIEGVL